MSNTAWTKKPRETRFRSSSQHSTPTSGGGAFNAENFFNTQQHSPVQSSSEDSSVNASELEKQLTSTDRKRQFNEREGTQFLKSQYNEFLKTGTRHPSTHLPENKFDFHHEIKRYFK